MKWFRTLALLLLLISPAAAQFTTVTGTVTDPNGLPYAFGKITPTLISSGTPIFTATGMPYSPPSQPVGFDINGSFVMNLADNTALSPGGSQWQFLVCSDGGSIQPSGGKGPVCFSLASPITISGSTQSITTQLDAVALALSFNPGSGTLTGGGTITRIAGWTGLSSLGNTALTDNGSVVSSSEPFATATLQLSGAGALALTGAGCGTLPALASGFGGFGLAAGCDPQINKNGAGWVSIINGLPYLLLSGGTMTGNLNLGGNTIVGTGSSGINVSGSLLAASLGITGSGSIGTLTLTAFAGASGCVGASAGVLVANNSCLASPGTGLNQSAGNVVNLNVALPNGETATTQAGGDNTTKVATDQFVQSAVASGSLFPGTLGQPVLNTTGLSVYQTSPVFTDCIWFTGATLDVQLNKCNAYGMTSGFGALDAKSLGGPTAQSIAAQVEIARPTAPTLTIGTGGSLTATTWFVMYCLISAAFPNCNNTAGVLSRESSIAITGTQSIVINPIVYPGLATSYAWAIGTSSNGELYCSGTTPVGNSTTITSSTGCTGALFKGNPSSWVALYSPPTCTWNVTITDGVSYGIEVDNQGGIVGLTAGEGSACRLHTVSTTNAGGLLATDINPVGASSYVNVKNFGVVANTAGAVLTNAGTPSPNTFGAAVVIAHLFDNSEVDIDSTNNLTPANQGTSVWAYNFCCRDKIRFHGEGLSLSGSDVCVIGATGQTMSETNLDANCVHPGSGFRNINYLGGGTDIHLNIYLEQGSATPSQPSVEIGSSFSGTGPVFIDSIDVGQGTFTTNPVLQFDSGITNYRVGSMQTATITTMITDNSVGPGYTCTVTPCVLNGYGPFQNTIYGDNAPGWLRYYGSGADGVGSFATNTNLAGLKYYTTFTLSAGATLTDNTNNTPLIIRATKSITICATCSIVASGNSTVAGDSGGSGGGGGGGAAGGTAGAGVKGVTGGAYGTLVTGGGGGAASGTGSNGTNTAVGLQRSFTDSGVNPVETNMVGGAPGGAGGSAGGAGGNGGGVIILDAPVCNLASGAALTSTGATGTAGGTNTGGGGGGGGGVIIVRCPILNDLGAVFTVTGGNGGAIGTGTSGAGGNGGNGWSVEIKQ